MSFVIYSRKIGKYLNQTIFTGSWRGIVWLKYICRILILPFWLVTPPCFLVKISQILQKVIAFFPERGEEIKTSFWHIWIWSFSALLLIFFDFGHFQEEKRGQSWTKSALDLSFFHKYSNPSKNFQTVFLLIRVLLLVRISAILDHITRVISALLGHIGGVSAQKPPKKYGTQNFGNF